MSRVSTFGLAVTGLLALAPAGLAAQGTDTNPDNTPYGTTSAEFLLFGAGARGTALGDAFAAVANDISSLYYNPAGVALISRPGRHGQHLRLRRRDQVQLGRHRLPLLRRLADLRPAGRHLRVR